MLETALNYAEKGFSVIPVKPDKKPYVKWEHLQKRQATQDEIQSWWKKWPNAGIGIVTGKVSGLGAFDFDTREAFGRFNDTVSDGFIGPIARSPRDGWHVYILHDARIGTGTGLIPGMDYRGEGAYIIAPPSRGSNGKHYRWLEGLSIFEVALPVLPDVLHALVLKSLKSLDLKRGRSGGGYRGTRRQG